MRRIITIILSLLIISTGIFAAEGDYLDTDFDLYGTVEKSDYVINLNYGETAYDSADIITEVREPAEVGPFTIVLSSGNLGTFFIIKTKIVPETFYRVEGNTNVESLDLIPTPELIAGNYSSAYFDQNNSKNLNIISNTIPAGPNDSQTIGSFYLSWDSTEAKPNAAAGLYRSTTTVEFTFDDSTSI